MYSTHMNHHRIISASSPNPKLSLSLSQHSPSNIFADTLVSLRRCVENQDLKAGSSLHAQILKSGLHTDVFISNSLLNMYSKCDRIHDARNLFDTMPHTTIVSWTTMMSAYHRSSRLDQAMLLFSRMVEHLNPNEFTLAVLLHACAFRGGDVNLIEAVHSHAITSGLLSDSFLRNCLIDAYAKVGMLTTAEKLLLRLCAEDVVSWTCVVSGCIRSGDSERGIALFCRMQEDGVVPNDIAMVTVLQACSEIGIYGIMQWIHGLVLKGNWWMSCLVLNSLIEMYSTNGYFNEAMRVFRCFCFGSEGLHPSPETMANLLHGCGRLKLGKEVHGYLIKHGFLPCTVAENSLMNMYAAHGFVHSSLLIFRSMAERDIVSWNTIMKCFVKNAQAADALRLLRESHGEGLREIDFVTLLTSLEACSELARIREGRVLHGYSMKTGLLGDIFVQNALIDMYAKSGRLDLAECVFEGMHQRDVGSWNSMITAYGVNGDGASAEKVFKELEREGTKKLNAITFTNALSACAHAGLVKEGFAIFQSMEKQRGVSRNMEHYACMVDLLGRAGRVNEAMAFIEKMPMRPGSDIWGALLSACVVVGNVALAERAGEELAALEPCSSIWRVALANAYAAAGKWEKVVELRGATRLRKEGGWSSVNVEGFEFDFFAGDTRHPEREMIYDVVGRLKIHMLNDGPGDLILLT
ncbi:pentatricopeptide repeat-containing protein At3g53360, mitochondrial-like [Salvia hispanica]|uniref:pentatricopeptide repeat-containing protein At3g53360, mitochondrial-like n=1 Tax=Salvia hispanica TaxID=49212 RepID=UPI00200901AF|nr:pentatricopeptide repeat-containing protein At3g53360, mitochondrial-like [Salvia hispanica]